jgi:hypothetical protein
MPNNLENLTKKISMRSDKYVLQILCVSSVSGDLYKSKKVGKRTNNSILYAMIE